MKEQWTKFLDGVKTFWAKLSKKAKILLATAAGVLLLAAVAVTVYLNNTGDGYVALYDTADAVEAERVYALIKEEHEEVEAKLENGQVMVPAEQKPGLIVDLAAEGYTPPKPDFNLWLTNNSFTMTDADKQKLFLADTTQRIETVVSALEGVDYCAVTLNVPADKGYVWDEKVENGSASVIVGMKEDYALTPERVTGIRRTVAASIPKTLPENVRVIDRRTGLDMEDDAEDLSSGLSFKRLDYERTMEKGLSDKIKTLLSQIYGPENVTPVVTIRLNYDLTKEELTELVPQDDGNGVKMHQQQVYDINGEAAVGDIVGEENNTDAPGYQNITTQDGDGKTTHYENTVDYDVSRRIVQTDSGPARIEEITASVIVRALEAENTEENIERLTDIIAKAINTTPDLISLAYTPIDVPAEDEDSAAAQVEPMSLLEFVMENWIVFAAIGGVLLLLLIAFLVIMMIRKKAKKKVIAAQEQAEDLMRTAQAEIDEHKRALAEAAQANNTKENAITNEVRDFAKQNPEITASLIRSLLKEEE